MVYMAGYEINDEDIEAVIRYLKIHDPKNADREYAIQYLESLRSFYSGIIRADIVPDEALKQALEKQASED